MAEEVGHGPDIHACTYELGCREVTKVVETHVGCTDSVAGPDEERCHVSGRNGVTASTNGERTKASSASVRPASSIQSSTRLRLTVRERCR